MFDGEHRTQLSTATSDGMARISRRHLPDALPSLLMFELSREKAGPFLECGHAARRTFAPALALLRRRAVGVRARTGAGRGLRAAGRQQGQLPAMAGKVMLVNFWATSCATCVKEMPQIVATHDKFKARGLDTLAVAMSYDPPAFVAKFAETRKLPFGVAIDNTGASPMPSARCR
jgi:thiol-disulfide isomerase/thioredoxin